MRKWTESISPKQANEFLHCYEHTTWLKDMDRCWQSDDGYSVSSRIIFTEWGKVEHATIQYNPDAFIKEKSIEQRLMEITGDGSRDIPWSIKQEIKNELWGKDRIAIEVFPQDKNLVDVQDCYHLWVMPKGFKMPFGIHPTRDVQCKTLNRGYPKLENSQYLINKTKNLYGE